MNKKTILVSIKELSRQVFTTNELAAFSGKSLSCTTQALNFLERQGLIRKLYRGIWGETFGAQISPYAVIPFLFSRQRAYLSFISALHLYGIVEQIPQTITLASTAHTRSLRTKVGTFSVHHIDSSFFDGFVWYKEKNNFLIAEPEKALIDCLYLSAFKKKQFAYFPELYFPKSFSFKKTREWAKKICSNKVRVHVENKLDLLLNRIQR